MFNNPHFSQWSQFHNQGRFDCTPHPWFWVVFSKSPSSTQMWDSLQRSCPSRCVDLQHIHICKLQQCKPGRGVKLGCSANTTNFLFLQFREFCYCNIFGQAKMSTCHAAQIRSIPGVWALQLPGSGFNAFDCNAQQFMLQKIAFQRIILFARSSISNIFSWENITMFKWFREARKTPI